jgi:hypothetical protein
MNWDALAAVAELFGALGVILTLAYLAVQIRQNTKLLTSSLADSARDAANEVSRILASDREAARVFWAGIEDRSSLTDQDRQQFDALLTLAFSGNRQFFNQAQRDELSAFEWLLAFPGARDWWASYSVTFAGAYRDYVDRLITERWPAAQQGAAAAGAPGPAGVVASEASNPSASASVGGGPRS